MNSQILEAYQCPLSNLSPSARRSSSASVQTFSRASGLSSSEQEPCRKSCHRSCCRRRLVQCDWGQTVAVGEKARSDTIAREDALHTRLQVRAVRWEDGLREREKKVFRATCGVGSVESSSSSSGSSTTEFRLCVGSSTSPVLSTYGMCRLGRGRRGCGEGCKVSSAVGEDTMSPPNMDYEYTCTL